jgi:hypothetical protein
MTPLYAKRGWTDRYRSRLVLTVLGETAFLIALLAVAFVYLWLLAPAGAAYPR